MATSSSPATATSSSPATATKGHKSVFLPIKSLLGTQPVDPQDDQSHAVIYRYPLITNDNSDHVDVSTAIPRINVLDFFYPHALSSEGAPTPQESLAWLNMRRDVFLLAFEAVQGLDPTDKWSYYQIAGIHGLPHAPFDGDESDWDSKNPEWWGGYCQHGSPLFPTWHRPYTMLLEQSIIRQAKLFANTLSDSGEKQAVLELADKLRFPYWDWASQSTRVLGLPEVFTSTDISLVYAWKSFSTTSIPNPLKAFVLPVNVGKPISSSDVYNPTAKPNYVVPSQGTPFTPLSYPTVRHVSAAYMSQNDKLNVTLMRNANSTLVEGVHAAFQHNQWLPFSNHYWSEATHGDGTQYGHYASLELVHDFVHGTIGGSGGHMAYPEVAAFDPIFFFHHVNVDRLIAIWQYCYPNSWIPQQPLQLNSDGTYTDEPDSKANAFTELTPFRLANEGAKFLTSSDVRLVDADCGYTYPEIIHARREGWTAAKMLEYVVELYEPPESFVHRWVLMVERIVKRAFNGPFSIRVFIGKADATASTSTSIPNFAGEIAIFARSTAGARCANCERLKCMRGSLDLTKTMVRLGITSAPLLKADGSPPSNPFSASGSLTLVFVDLQGHQLDPSTALGDWEGPKVSLYYQQGVPRENINEYLVEDNIDISPKTIQKFALASPQVVISTTKSS